MGPAQSMRRSLRFASIVGVASIAALLSGAGCVNVPLGQGRSIVPPRTVVEVEQNPVFVPMGPDSYGTVFENVLQVLGDYGFEIQESNRFDGRIETVPRVAPGLALFLKPGSPLLYDRLLSTCQSYRHRVSVIIHPADQGGYFIEVVARKELEDLSKPLRATAGAVLFKTDNDIERQYEVIDPTVYHSNWIYRCRDAALEQELIRLLKQCM